MSASSGPPAHLDPSLTAAVRDGVARATAVTALAGVALIHLLDLPGTFGEQPYKGWLYLGLIGGCLLAAAALIRDGDTRAWLAATLLPLGAISGYVISRTVGLSGGADDIGNWTEPLGLASLFVEGSLVALAAAVLRSRGGALIEAVAR
ncbi:MAG TPA: hypothetical protein VLV28_03840 [Gaiellaceae bacterium]|nr:hypothetical protein [Gaiellaceae bacterium]